MKELLGLIIGLYIVMHIWLIVTVIQLYGDKDWIINKKYYNKTNWEHIKEDSFCNMIFNIDIATVIIIASEFIGAFVLNLFKL